jgi:ADP-ribosylglycohydrolase
MDRTLQQRIINSALWAAYGDVIGFPSELIDEVGLKRRIGMSQTLHPVKWKRMIGGKFGVWADLEAGSYSDDTQLRLSTSRAIRGDGYFDVEAFAKVELPIWLSYCLGAGRGSKLGASNLCQRNVNWFSNFFDQRGVSYINGGGNGGAMRIQPHVWATNDLTNSDSYLSDVIRNTLCTHGHPRAIAGAVIHAACLAATLEDSHIPTPNSWRDLGVYISLAFKIIASDSELSIFWLPTWEKNAAASFEAEMEKVKTEWEHDVDICLEWINKDSQTAYENIVKNLGGLTPDQRGSGIKCALFSLVAAWCHRERGPYDAIVMIANCLWSDTDTIGTMTGALLGAMSLNEPEDFLQDREYLRSEASRLFRVSRGTSADSFQYPDLISWYPPKTQLDIVGLIGERLALAGLGFATPVSEQFNGNKLDYSYQWLKLDFGQSVLCKRRKTIVTMNRNLYPGAVAPTREYVQPKQLEKLRVKVPNSMEKERDLFHALTSVNSSEKFLEVSSTTPQINSSESIGKQNTEPTLDELTDKAIKSGFDPRVIGIDLLSFAERANGIELAISYSAIIVKARSARLQRNRS